MEGTVYPLLNRLKKSGHIQHVWRESDQGPPRKYYSITKKGIEFLIKLDSTWKDLAEAVRLTTKTK